jgi:hypothetical protein
MLTDLVESLQNIDTRMDCDDEADYVAVGNIKRKYKKDFTLVKGRNIRRDDSLTLADDLAAVFGIRQDEYGAGFPEGSLTEVDSGKKPCGCDDCKKHKPCPCGKKKI